MKLVEFIDADNGTRVLFNPALVQMVEEDTGDRTLIHFADSYTAVAAPLDQVVVALRFELAHVRDARPAEESGGAR